MCSEFERPLHLLHSRRGRSSNQVPVFRTNELPRYTPISGPSFPLDSSSYRFILLRILTSSLTIKGMSEEEDQKGGGVDSIT
jgi:hypothetical protein